MHHNFFSINLLNLLKLVLFFIFKIKKIWRSLHSGRRFAFSFLHFPFSFDPTSESIDPKSDSNDPTSDSNDPTSDSNDPKSNSPVADEICSPCQESERFSMASIAVSPAQIKLSNNGNESRINRLSDLDKNNLWVTSLQKKQKM